MRKRCVLVVLVFVVAIALMSAIVCAAETVSEGEFNPEDLIINGVALVPLISTLISILKGWIKLDKKYIPLLNVVLGAAAVLAVGVLNKGMTWSGALIMTLGVVFGSSMFHDTFGHAFQALSEALGKKQQSGEVEEFPKS
jgi:hypothetical protein